MAAHTATGTSVLVFQETEFDVTDLRGQPWLRGLQVATALGYSDPSRSVSELYSRNIEEFDDSMTQLVKLPGLDSQSASPGQQREVRIFSPRGCYLLGMFARTDKAREFRRWVLDVLEGHAAPKMGTTMSPSQFMTALTKRDRLIDKLAETRLPGSALDRYENYRMLSRLLGMSYQPLEALCPAMKQLPLEGQ